MNLNRPLLLASNSPRRQELLRALGFPIEVLVKPVEEDFPDDMRADEVPVYLARKKAAAYNAADLGERILITADTVVCLGEEILNKPADAVEATRMLQRLSGKSHRVITGVCLRDKNREQSFTEETIVHFKHLTEEEISYYISHYKPFDKAGAYGIQEWIGMIGITKIEGSYYNVMGLPVHRLYQELSAWD